VWFSSYATGQTDIPIAIISTALGGEVNTPAGNCALSLCRAGIQIGVDIFIVRNAAVVPYLRDGLHHRDAQTQLPVLPPEVTRIELSWMAEDDVVFRPSRFLIIFIHH